MRPALLLQYILPHRLLSRLVYWATRWTFVPWKNWLIQHFICRYHVNLDEAELTDPDAYPHFNAFFTRALKSAARPPDPDPCAVLCPADGCISQAGVIRDGRIFQAKGQDFSAAELLGDNDMAKLFREGSFITLYLSPRDYHRVHMPLTGTLVETIHIPGRLFSVAPFTVEAIPRVFARNERLVCRFEGSQGPFIVVLVGAMLVSSVETIWGGLEIPPYASHPEQKSYRGQGIHLERGAELGRFNMGSTVIMLLPLDGARLNPNLSPQQPVQLGERIGYFH